MGVGRALIGVAALGVSFCPSALSQMRPDAPLEDFSLPRFGETGYKVWELRGTRGHYLSDTRSAIDGLDLRLFAGDAALTLETRILSPRAEIDLELGSAFGDSSLFVTGPAFEITGFDWEWENPTKTLRVNERARVIFNQEIDLLR